MARKHKLEQGRTYDTFDGKKLHIIRVKPNGVNGDNLYNIKISGDYKGETPAQQVYKYIYGK